MMLLAETLYCRAFRVVCAEMLASTGLQPCAGPAVVVF